MVADGDRLWVDAMPEAYERWLAPMTFAPFADDLARRVAARRPGRVLELAAGTGMLTRALLRDGCGSIVATDLNAGMVEVGRRLAPGADWRQADAMRLPFDRSAFDAVVCQFGVMFFPDKPAAFAEARRLLAPGGALLFNAWDDIGTHTFEWAVQAALGRLFPDDPPTFLASVPHGYADPDAIRRDLRDAGFTDVWLETVTLPTRAASAADVAAGYCAGTPLRAGIEARGADLTATTAAVAEQLTATLGDGPVTGRMAAHVVEASG